MAGVLLAAVTQIYNEDQELETEAKGMRKKISLVRKEAHVKLELRKHWLLKRLALKRS